LAQPEAITFVARLALAFADDFLTGWERFFAMVVVLSLGAISQYVHAVIRKTTARAAPCSSSTRIPSGSTCWTPIAAWRAMRVCG
jgi:hypothetical protein